MKKTIAVAVLVVACLAFGATQYTRMLNLNVLGKSMLGTTAEANAITRSLYGSGTINFTAAASGCADSSGITVTGALAGDACDVGVPASVATADAGAQSHFSCYVSAANTVKVRWCTYSFEDPASETYTVRVTSAQ